MATLVGLELDAVVAAWVYHLATSQPTAAISPSATVQLWFLKVRLWKTAATA